MKTFDTFYSEILDSKIFKEIEMNKSAESSEVKPSHVYIMSPNGMSMLSVDPQCRKTRVCVGNHRD
jgi:hypothetical protein